VGGVVSLVGGAAFSFESIDSQKLRRHFASQRLL
jgi:hypothetical protein